MKKSLRKKISPFIASIILTNIALSAAASGFNIPFMNGADLGNLYAGWAAEANDASTEFSNPAGLVRISNQQLVLAGVGIVGNTEFDGNTTPPFSPFAPQTGSASSNLGAFLPSFYYAIPASQNVVVGFGETIPFGLGTNYDKDSIVRYGATTTQIAVIDFGPAVGIKINDKLSLGLGFDADHLSLTLNRMIYLAPNYPDAESQNSMWAWGYGCHAGILYQFTPATRVGVNYSTPVTFYPSGNSSLFMPGGTEFRSTHLQTNLTLPALAQASIYHDINPRWAVMGTVFYSNWSTLEQVTLQNLMIPTGTTITSTTPFNYHNTFDYAVGANFKATNKWLLKAGLELLDTPTNSTNRTVNDPLGSASIVSVGAHYQQNRNLGYDIGYAHCFFNQMNINNYTATNTEVGHSNSYNNVLGAQLTWNIT